MAIATLAVILSAAPSPVYDSNGYGTHVWLEFDTSDTNAASFTFKTTVATNNFNPEVYGTHPYQLLNDVQLQYGYNLPGTEGYNPNLLTWGRGFESCWFNPPRQPQIEVYDRLRLTNWAGGVFRDVGFGYTVQLPSGYVTAAIDADQLVFRNPYVGGTSYMSATATTNGEAVLNLNGAYIDFFQNTNAWLINGFYGNYSNVLFSSGGGYDNVTFFKGANSVGSDLRLSVGSENQRSLRWDGTNASGSGWSYQLADGTFRRFNDEVSPIQKSYTVPNNTTIGSTAGDYRTLGALTNAVQEYIAGMIQFDLMIFSGNSFNENTCQRYVIPLDSDTYSGGWQEMLPEHEVSRGEQKNYALDMNYSGGQRVFRVRCSRNSSGTGSFFGVVTTYGHNLWTADVSGSGSNATVIAQDWHYTQMSKRDLRLIIQDLQARITALEQQ